MENLWDRLQDDSRLCTGERALSFDTMTKEIRTRKKEEPGRPLCDTQPKNSKLKPLSHFGPR